MAHVHQCVHGRVCELRHYECVREYVGVDGHACGCECARGCALCRRGDVHGCEHDDAHASACVHVHVFLPW